MRSFRNDGKGQFIVLAAIIIAAFMFSLVLTISQMSLNRQELSYEPIDEIVLAITSDFERCLTKALAIATQENDETEGEAFIQEWFRATLESYKEFGIDITLTGESQGRNVDWEIEWGKGSGKSRVYTTFGVNIGAYGLEGLAITSIKAVYLNIIEAKMIFAETGNKTIIVFKVEQGGKRYEAISDLTPENLELKINGENIDRKDLNLSLIYVGEGTYIAQFNPNNLIVRNVTLMITTNDGIKVAASLESCLISFKSDDGSTTQSYDNGGYFIIDGTQRNPPYIISLFPNQTLNISFNPPDGSTFERFSFSGPLTLNTPESPSAIVRVLGEGSGEIVANYNSSSLNPPLMCYLILESREYSESSSENLKHNLGTFNIANETMSWSFTGSTELPANLSVSYDQTLQISFSPAYGYVFKYWNITSNTVWITSGSGTESSINVTVKGNGSITAVYEKSRPGKWRYVFLSAKKEGEIVKKEFFFLTLEPEKNLSEITPQLNNPHDKRSGNTTESTPKELYLGGTVDIILYAYYSKNKESIDVNVTLGFYNSGVLYRIGSQIITVTKPDNNTKYLVYKISFNTSGLGDPPVIPKGSWLTLILERMDPNDGGTLHISCGEASKIKLW